MTDNRSAERFDRWAASYDKAVRRTDAYPFAGYEAILDRIVEWSEPGPTNRVLDLGIGTGNLARRFVGRAAEICGVDFSARMVETAAARLPDARVVQADLLSAWPEELPNRFDRIVSAYVVHHFDDAVKIDLLARLAERLSPGGRIVIGDIAFPNRDAMEETRDRWAAEWDPDEFPWVAAELLPRLAGAWRARFEPLSFCGGVFRFHRLP